MRTESLSPAALLSFFGLFLLLSGMSMLLARRNRSLSIFPASAVYVTSFGRRREFDLSQISTIQLTSSRSIRFLGSCGKKLFAVEGNMIGTEHLSSWIEHQNIPVKTTKTLEHEIDHDDSVTGPSYWHEEDRTGLHDHLGAIRIGLILTVLLFAAGCVVPFALYVNNNLKMAHAIYLTAVSPLPMILYCIAFAPVILIKERPKGATAEWNALHIKFPMMSVLFLTLLFTLQFFKTWDGYILQVVDNGRFSLLVLAFASILIAPFYLRTPRRLRERESMLRMCLVLILLCYGLAYSTSLALSEPAKHYPAVVVAREKPGPDEKDTRRKLTILLDDGTPARLIVTDQLYDLEEAGTEFVVCQKENFLGIRMVRLHLPQTDEAPAETP